MSHHRCHTCLNSRRAWKHSSLTAPPRKVGFVDIARAFRAEVAEPAVPLHEAHHGQVSAALDDFHTKLQADAVRSRAVDHTVGPNEAKAIRLLAAALGMSNVSAQEKALLAAALHAIRVAKFQDLPRKLDALQKAVTKMPVTTAAYLDKLVEIVRGYPLIVDEESPGSAPESSRPADYYVPEIILSESFATAS